MNTGDRQEGPPVAVSRPGILNSRKGAPLEPLALLPFNPAVADIGCSLTVRAVHHGTVLELRYHLNDPAGRVRIKSTAAHPARREGLWRSTCLEAFITEPATESYWELNLAPGGHWNLARFRGYRQPAGDSCPLAELRVGIHRSTDGLELDVALPLAPLGLAGRVLQLGLCAVVESCPGGLEYHALAHPGNTPDFHLREGWVLTLPSPEPSQDDAEL